MYISKITIKKIGHHPLERYDGPFLLVLVLVTRIISSALGCRKQWFFRVTLENNLMYNLWKNRAILDDIDTKRSSGPCFQVIIFIPQVTGFVHAFSYINLFL